MHRSNTLFAADGRFYFLGVHNHIATLYTTDGVSPPIPLTGLGVDTRVQKIFTAKNGVFLSVLNDGVQQLWKTDGTVGGTIRLAKGLGMFAASATTAATIFSYAGTLWRTDGTVAGTQRILKFGSTAEETPSNMRGVGDNVFFTVAALGLGQELWKTNGTAAGTGLVKDINPGPGASRPTELTISNGKIYFAATDPTAGRELWQTDGTSSGTVRALDLEPGIGGSDPTNLIHFNGALFFSAAPYTTAREFWRFNN